MSVVNVYKASTLLAAAKQQGDNILRIVPKKTEKVFKGTTFSNARFMIPGTAGVEGWFSIETPIELPSGIADPADKNDIRNTYEGTRMNFQTTVSRAGELGEALVIVNKPWREYAQSVAGNRTVIPLVQTHYSADNKHKPNGEIEDPIIRFQVDFDKYPATHPHKFLQNQPKTQILDFDKSYEENGKINYRPATLDNGDALTKENFHLFVTPGSKLMPGSRISMPSSCISKSYVSLPMIAGKSIIQRGPPPGFSDDARPEDLTKLMAALTINTSPKPEIKPVEPEIKPLAKPITPKVISPEEEKKVDDTLPTDKDIAELIGL